VLLRAVIRVVPAAAVLAAVLAFAAPASAATFDVNTQADTTDGLCENPPGDCSIRDAVAASDATPGNNTIVIPAGTYTLTNGELDSAPAVPGRLTIKGAGPGATIIDGGGASRVLNAAPFALEISGLTIRNGAATGDGGGLLADALELTLTDVDFRSNSATGVGGGASVPGSSTVSLTNVNFSDNTAGLGGGGLAIAGAVNTSIAHSTLTGNKTTGGAGGGLSLIGSLNLTITDSTVDANTAGTSGAGSSGDGGGIAIVGSVATSILRTSVDRNVAAGGAAGPSASGGGISLDAAISTSLTDSSVSGNTAEASGDTTGDGAAGGGVSMSPAVFTTFERTTIAENRALANGGSSGAGATGGGIAADTGVDTNVVNSTLSGNSAAATAASSGSGGGYGESQSGGTVVRYSTLDRNSALGPAGAGGDFSSQSPGGPSPEVDNSIVAGGTGAAGMENCNTPLTSNGHNVESADTCGFSGTGDAHGVDPKLAPLADNGGPTRTEALLAGSPAINAGDPALCPATDQRGVTRPQEGACDAGAFELIFTADLGVTETVSPDPATAGDRLTYVITVTNNGPFDTSAHVVDALPPELVEVSATPSSGVCSSAPVSCDFGTLASGASATVTVVANTTAAGAVTNTAVASGSRPDPNPANDRASVTSTVLSPVSPPPPPGARVRGSIAGGGGACHASSFVVRFRVTGGGTTRSSRVLVDGHEVATSPRVHFRVRIAVAHLAPGRHVLTLIVSSAGHTSRRTAVFSRCRPRPVEPRFTG
jgi:uncharacterized repeat protein (TIGR01451 family)